MQKYGRREAPSVLHSLHLTFIFADVTGQALLLFLIFKTLADGIMHVLGRRITSKSAESQVEKT